MPFGSLFDDASVRSTAEMDVRSLPPELQLLLACSRIRPTSYDKARQQALITAGIDWCRFLSLVEKHQVTPVVWRNLQRLAGHVPACVLAKLDLAYAANAGHVLEQAAELTTLVKQLNAEGIPHMVLKGLAVAVTLYGDATLRQSGDIDLLVNEVRLPRVGQLLIDLGYREVRAERMLTAAQNYIQNKFLTHHRIYQHRLTHTVVEVHWRLFTNPYLLPVDPFHGLHTQAIPFGAVTLLSLAEEDLLIYLCVHGDSHLWAHLKWQIDLLHFLEAQPERGWPRILARARELGVSRSLLSGLLLAFRLYNAPLPAPVGKEIQADPALIDGFNVVCNLLPAGRFMPASLTLPELIISFRYQLKLRAGLRYRGHLWISRCFSAEDWRVIKLPDVLFPLYILLRPFLLLIRLRRRHRAGAAS